MTSLATRTPRAAEVAQTLKPGTHEAVRTPLVSITTSRNQIAAAVEQRPAG